MDSHARARRQGQVPGCGVTVGHPVDVSYAAVDRVSETSGSASGFFGSSRCEVATTDHPLVVLLSKHGTDESAYRRAIREDAHDVGPAPDLLVQSLLGIVRPHLLPVSSGGRL